MVLTMEDNEYILDEITGKPIVFYDDKMNPYFKRMSETRNGKTDDIADNGHQNEKSNHHAGIIATHHQTSPTHIKTRHIDTVQKHTTLDGLLTRLNESLDHRESQSTVATKTDTMKNFLKGFASAL